MIRTRLLPAVCLAVALAFIAAIPANALYVRPAKAMMLDADGQTNGCELKIAEAIITPVHQRVQANLRVTCPESAAVRRMTYEWGVWEVMPDDSLREVDPYQLKARSTSLTPIVGVSRVPVAIAGCLTSGQEGTHTWLVRARVSVKQTSDNSDPHPYFAKVDRRQTVAC